MDNQIPPWEAYLEYISSCLIPLNKWMGVRPVGVEETWRQLFEKFVMKATGLKATDVCKDDHICSRLKVEIEGAVHGVQAIWDDNLSIDN